MLLLVLQAGLKTGMYYLRTRAAADAIKFTVDQQALAKNRAKAAVAATAAAVAALEAPSPAVLKARLALLQPWPCCTSSPDTWYSGPCLLCGQCWTGCHGCGVVVHFQHQSSSGGLMQNLRERSVLWPDDFTCDVKDTAPMLQLPARCRRTMARRRCPSPWPRSRRRHCRWMQTWRRSAAWRPWCAPWRTRTSAWRAGPSLADSPGARSLAVGRAGRLVAMGPLGRLVLLPDKIGPAPGEQLGALMRSGSWPCL